MKRFLNSVLCMCIAVFCTHAQKKNVMSAGSDGHYDRATFRCQGIPFFESRHLTGLRMVIGLYIIVEENYISFSPKSPGEPQLINSDYATRCNNDHVISAGWEANSDQ